MPTLAVKRNLLRLQDFYVLSVAAVIRGFRKPYYLREALEQMEYVGPGSLAIVFLVSLFVGMALSLQISAELSRWGFKLYTGKVVGITVIREIGPLAVAISVAGRAGSGMASEIGSMLLTHQVDALRVFGVDPVKKLVTPRVAATVLMLPALTVIGDAVSILGAYFVSVFMSHQSGIFFWNQIRLIMTYQNILIGLIKPFIFGYIIAATSCYMGLATRGGAKGLRRTTTAAVVGSILAMIVADFILTRILLYAFGLAV